MKSIRLRKDLTYDYITILELKTIMRLPSTGLDNKHFVKDLLLIDNKQFQAMKGK